MEEKKVTYDNLMSVLYSDEERHKIEWAMESTVNSKIQKFLVSYGPADTRKSSAINNIKHLFGGYHTVVDYDILLSEQDYIKED